MPSNFVKTLSSAPAPNNSVTEFVSTRSSLANTLPGLVQTANALTNEYVMGQFADDVAVAPDNSGLVQQDFEIKAKQLREQIQQAAKAKDSEAETKFTQEYSALAKAERQGRISANNAQIRQEAMLKQYINRYPHLESRFRDMYSVTRASNAANQTFIDDPFDKGVQDAMQAAAKEGINLSEYWRRNQEAYDRDLLAKRAASGANIYGEVSQYVNRYGSKQALDWAMQWITERLANDQNMGGDFNAKLMQGQMDIAEEQFVQSVAYPLLDEAVKRSSDPNAILNREQVDGILNQYRKAFDSVKGLISASDSLENFKRARDILSNKQMLEIEQEVPLFGEIVKANPELTKELFGKVNLVANLRKQGQLSLIQTELENATKRGDWITASQYKVAWAITNDISNANIAQNMNNLASTGRPTIAPTGNPIADAQITERTVEMANTLGDPKIQAAAVNHAIDTELRQPDADSYSLSPYWYTNPNFSTPLRTNPETKRRMDQVIESGTANVLDAITTPEEAKAIKFSPNPVKEGTTDQPWGVYPQGGPFETTKPTMFKSGSGNFEMRTEEADRVYALNRSYWIKRTAYGKVQADAWAAQVMQELKTQAEPPKPAGKE